MLTIVPSDNEPKRERDSFPASERLLWDEKQVRRFIGIGETLLRKLEREDKFPRAIRCGRKFKRWDAELVRAWVLSHRKAA